jgi:hypothetical protein
MNLEGIVGNILMVISFSCLIATIIACIVGLLDAFNSKCPKFWARTPDWNISPRFHGICWYDASRAERITCLIPFNIVVMILYHSIWYISNPYYYGRRLRDAFISGYKKGRG